MRTKEALISGVSILQGKINSRWGYVLLLWMIAGTAYSQTAARTVISINESWQFHKGKNPNDTLQDKWQIVQVPHTWNAQDVMDDAPGYYRGVGWYRKKIAVSNSFKNQDVTLYFEGAGQEAEVFINGKKAGQHTGGYTGFYIPASRFLQFDGKENINEILVKVDNSYNENVPPLSADFTFYGGLYRDVFFIAANPLHFSYDEKGSRSVFITTPSVSAERGEVNIKGNISAINTSIRKIELETVIQDKQGNVVSLQRSKLSIQPGKEFSFEQQAPPVVKPHLWSPEDPYLYTVTSSIIDPASNKILDELTHPLGFRWFHFDADKGFFLNGNAYKLVGASRHQDYAGLGNAVPDELARKDISLLKKMGGNFLRVAHYPQDPSVLEACDQLGILASVEIPIVNEITETAEFFRNCLTMQMEMIRQNFNHPSVIIWCHMNEVLLRPHFANDKPRQEVYFKEITRLAKTMDSIARKADPYRNTMIANHGDFEKYRQTGLTAIPDVVGWNLYSGWYGGKMEDFPVFLDRHHRELPDKPVVISEYGSDADPRIRSFHPVRFDKSVEYTTRFHQYYIQEMLKRPFVAGAMIWNLADFNSETRAESMPHINNKGLLMWDRTAKDPYYLYKATLSTEPVIAITSSYWKYRTGIADSSELVCYQPLQVASNLDSVELIINGKTAGFKKIKEGLAEWKIPFRNGINQLETRGQRNGQWYTDHLSVDFALTPYSLKDERVPFRQLNILLGANRYFIDEKRKQVWQPDQPYRKNSWGSVGGKIFKVTGNSRLPYGTDRNIEETDEDPIYQTQQQGIEQYKLDVPTGKYELTLHFAELQGGAVKGLVYNLENTERSEDTATRVFSVFVNDIPVLENLNIARQYGVATAVSKKLRVTVSDDKGIAIVFKASKGEAVLNALQVVKID
jgi:beta-galactosidase